MYILNICSQKGIFVTISKGNYSIMQPTIRPLFDTRQFQEALLLWSDNSTSYYDYLRGVSASIATGTTWNKLVHDGVYATPVTSVASGSADYASAATTLAQAKKHKCSTENACA